MIESEEIEPPLVCHRGTYRQLAVKSPKSQIIYISKSKLIPFEKMSANADYKNIHLVVVIGEIYHSG